MGNTADIEYRGHLARIQRQMVALLPRYCLSDKLLKQVSSIQSSKNPHKIQVHHLCTTDADSDPNSDPIPVVIRLESVSESV